MSLKRRQPLEMKSKRVIIASAMSEFVPRDLIEMVRECEHLTMKDLRAFVNVEGGLSDEAKEEMAEVLELSLPDDLEVFTAPYMRGYGMEWVGDTGRTFPDFDHKRGERPF